MEEVRRWKPSTPCQGNEAVMCSDHSKCSGCGWNPEVAAKRLESIEKELKRRRRTAK